MVDYYTKGEIDELLHNLDIKKQDTLHDGEDQNIAQINHKSLLGKGNFELATLKDMENYYNKDDTQRMIYSIIGAPEKFDIIEVAELPPTGLKATIYLIKNDSAENLFDKYIWTGKWIYLGQTSEDLSDFYNKSEIDDLLNTKQEKLVSGVNLSKINNLDLLTNTNLDFRVKRESQVDWALDYVEGDMKTIKNKPKIPEKLTDFEDHTNYLLKSEMVNYCTLIEAQEIISSKINEFKQFKYEIVDALEDITEPKTNVIYFVRLFNVEKDDYHKFEEYMYLKDEDDVGFFERIGVSKNDLNNYYTKSVIDEKIDSKVSKVSGKDLSTNDFTDYLKEKLNNYDEQYILKLISEKLDVSEAEKTYAKNVHTHNIEEIVNLQNILNAKENIINKKLSISVEESSTDEKDYVSVKALRDYVPVALSNCMSLEKFNGDLINY